MLCACDEHSFDPGSLALPTIRNPLSAVYVIRNIIPCAKCSLYPYSTFWWVMSILSLSKEKDTHKAFPHAHDTSCRQILALGTPQQTILGPEQESFYLNRIPHDSCIPYHLKVVLRLRQQWLHCRHINQNPCAVVVPWPH